MTTHDELVAARRPDLADRIARHAQALCVSLARCSRSLLLYDPHNDAVAGFLDELRAVTDRTDAPLALEVVQDAFLLGDESVYLDRDRDRSLPFRLWRDGVRRVAVAPDAPWEAWVRLVEILAVRLSRIRGDEDDVVSLVWRAELGGLRLDAVDGLVFGTQAGDGRSFEHHLPPPEGLDAPAPSLADVGTLAFEPVEAEALASLRAELGPAALEHDALRLAHQLLEAHGDGHVQPELLVTALVDLRDHLVREGRLRAVLDLLALVRRGRDGERVHQVLLQTLTGRESLLRLVRGVPPDDGLLVEELIALLEGLPDDPLRCCSTSSTARSPASGPCSCSAACSPTPRGATSRGSCTRSGRGRGSVRPRCSSPWGKAPPRRLGGSSWSSPAIPIAPCTRPASP